MHFLVDKSDIELPPQLEITNINYDLSKYGVYRKTLDNTDQCWSIENFIYALYE